MVGGFTCSPFDRHGLERGRDLRSQSSITPECSASEPGSPGSGYGKSPKEEPSSCELLKIQTYIWFQPETRACAINVRRD